MPAIFKLKVELVKLMVQLVDRINGCHQIRFSGLRFQIQSTQIAIIYGRNFVSLFPNRHCLAAKAGLSFLIAETEVGRS